MEIGMNLAVRNLENKIVEAVNQSGLPTTVSFLLLKKLTDDIKKVAENDIEIETEQYRKAGRENGKGAQEHSMGKPSGKEDGT